MRPGPLAALVAVLACAVLAASAAARKRSIYHSPLLWATVNVCDTEDHADSIGIRGSMPGSGFARERMYMRFQAQYFRASDQHWHNLPGGDSGFLAVGSARYRARQAGRVFVFAPPSGRTYLLRGAVTFEWRRGSRIVRRARKRTSAGHRSAAGADPPGYSAATCTIV